MVFGGLNQKRQISLIDQCSLNRVGTLEFNFNNGACTTAYDQVYLCFDERNTKQCYTASGRDSQKSLLDKNCSISNLSQIHLKLLRHFESRLIVTRLFELHHLILN